MVIEAKRITHRLRAEHEASMTLQSICENQYVTRVLHASPVLVNGFDDDATEPIPLMLSLPDVDIDECIAKEPSAHRSMEVHASVGFVSIRILEHVRGLSYCSYNMI